ncbi:MAG TPA: metalloregulator ArsR/SmtB family transcription factor, partial [Spirochaetia bacterium]
MPVETRPQATEEGEDSVRELLGFFLALADQSRLKIVGLLSQEDHTVEQLADLVGLRASTVSHHLARLAEAGLVSARADGHYSVYSLDTQVVHVMARRLLKPEALSQLAHGVGRSTFEQKVLATFTGSDGRFTAFPAQ